MLAAAGIYLVLDVNSPLPSHHLNRYEPWTTYDSSYLENVFNAVHQFSTYNNTLGFFAGNEIINDKLSATNSPVFVKAVVRDIKAYIAKNSPRPIPVGYSAADDLDYRISLSQYLECADSDPLESIDFYGVNSYQWCGVQNMDTSGYHTLVNDYKQYSKPVFLSEYGCNEVLPRRFDEVQALYSPAMVNVFSGGLVYEFTQEPNNYGLVKVLPNGDVNLLPDYFQYQYQLDTLPHINYQQINKQIVKSQKQFSKFKHPQLVKCSQIYQNLDISKGVPQIPYESVSLIKKGANVTRGRFIHLSQKQLTNKFNIYYNETEEYPITSTVQIDDDANSNRVSAIPNNSMSYRIPNLKPSIKSDSKNSIINRLYSKLSTYLRKTLE
jgi:hypothetical protein